jgi:deazaflavin-dependent oxidoreductase (nitroreductase family)
MDDTTFWQHDGPEAGPGAPMNKRALRIASAVNVLIYRLSRGKWLGRFPSGAPVCLLTTKGRKSGRSRTVPLLYLADGDDFIVVASQGGRPQHPGWYLNLEADPSGELTIGSRRLLVTAQRVSEEERARLWPHLVAIYPSFRDYQRRTTRLISVVRLSEVHS